MTWRPFGTGPASPSGAAGGVLSGSYPAPGFASDILSQFPEASRADDIAFSIEGPVALGETMGYPVPYNGEVTCELYCGTGAVGSPLTVAFKVDGATIETLSIAANSTAPTIDSTTHAVTEGDLVSCEVTSAGSGVPAEDVLAKFRLVMF